MISPDGFVAVAASFLAGYLIGSVLFASLICFLVTGKDIRTLGNGNPGAANLFESVNRTSGFVALALDAAKALVPLLIGSRILGLSYAALGLLGLGTMLGHKFPLYLGFKGGRAAATLAGIYLYFIPLEILIALVVSLPVLLLAKERKRLFVPLVFFLGSLATSMFFSHPPGVKLVVVFSGVVFVALNADKLLGRQRTTSATRPVTDAPIGAREISGE